MRAATQLFSLGIILLCAGCATTPDRTVVSEPVGSALDQQSKKYQRYSYKDVTEASDGPTVFLELVPETDP